MNARNARYSLISKQPDKKDNIDYYNIPEVEKTGSHFGVGIVLNHRLLWLTGAQLEDGMVGGASSMQSRPGRFDLGRIERGSTTVRMSGGGGGRMRVKGVRRALSHGWR